MGNPGAGYTCRYILLLMASSATLAVTVFLNNISMVPIDIGSGWFQPFNDTKQFPYPVSIQPSDFTFFMWSLVYLWQAVWLIYCLTSLCRRNGAGAVFLNPPIITPIFLAMFCVIMALNIGWLFLFDMELIVWAAFVSFLLTASLIVMLYINCRNVDIYGVQLLQEHKFDLWANRILIQNGLALYAGWCSISTILNLIYTFVYGGVMTSSGGNMDENLASLIGISLIGLNIVLYFYLENFVWERYMRYTYTVWGAFLWAVIGIMTKDFSYDVNTFIAFGLLGMTFILFIVKIILSIWRSHAKPLYIALSPVPQMI
ncbi:uncharacterized protein [Amphiura filiformis]|uniref:uncharacterized protein n=1 Tax=Amphiura filiformis TaxID=82378 RepID=UPI003B227575